ncbi:elongator complex protein 2 [Culicoides brevitarsis]|uniref:elongator complex protein 2 n=1 Tax=Culicoides brevitarsis TaxID=469753 RepID=UPI00307B9CD0
MVKIENTYTSVACNRTSNSLDWNKSNRIAFAAKNSVAIYEETDNKLWKITQQLVKHTDRVNVVQWIHDRQGTVTGLISGADDKNSIIWVGSRGNDKNFVLQGHEGSVTTVDSLEFGENYLFVTTGADCTIKVWLGKLTDDDVKCVQTIDLHGRLCFALKLIPVDGEKCLLAFGTDDCKVVLMSLNAENNFEKILVLTGHEDWILGLDYTTNDGNILLASSSQDTFIRLWKISKVRKREATEIVSKFTVNVEADDRRFKLGDELYSVSLESVLQGHEGWVSSVHWHKNGENLQLLSSSADKTLIIWQPDSDGIWTERVRTGEVGGNGFGFFGAKFSPDGSSIIGHAYYGSLHRWSRDTQNDRLWNPAIVTSGHFAEVQDLVWEPQGKFLVTVSHDQTTRIHAPWIRDNREMLWHELARPQIHGYDMHCVAMVSRYRLASGAEEKIIRVFDAPVNFVENFREICSITDDAEGNEVMETRSKGASRPTLGLSNRAVNENTVVDATELPNHQYPEHYFVETKFTEPPKEETLMQNTLWPEIQKLYGHDGYEVFSLASSHNGKLLASSCKATTADHAQILLWDTTTWKVIQKLRSHQLTITQMKFSPNDKHLLTVSRDRKWSLFEQNPENGNFDLVGCSNPKGGIHARIIWTCDWTGDGKYFVTGSRDKKVVAWTMPPSTSATSEMAGVKSLSTLETEADVTAIAVSPKNLESGYLIAIGFGSGVISLYNLNTQDGAWSLVHRMPQEIAHHLPVKRLSFRPASDKIELASCSEDNSVKIFQINL